MAYRIEFKPSALRDFKKLPRTVQKRVAEKIDALSVQARPPGCKAIQGIENLTRIRMGDYRLVYQIIDARLLILIVRIGHRSEVYRGI